MTDLRTESLLDLEHSIAGAYLGAYIYPWLIIPHIKEIVLKIGAELSPEEYYSPSDGIWISKRATVAPTAALNAPLIVCAGAEIRHCAFIRGSVIVGCGAVVGNSTEMKNTIIFDGVQIPHFNYVGDSVLGYKSHLGAGAVTSNVKSDRSEVSVRDGDAVYPTGLRKLGAILGDYAEIGCNGTLNPGTIVCRHSSVYPNSSVRSVVPAGSIYKSTGTIVLKS